MWGVYMKKYLLFFLLVIFVFVTIYGVNLENKKSQASRISNKKEFRIDQNYNEDLYIKDSTAILNSKINGDLILENTTVEVAPDSSISGNIYIIDSKLITATTEIEAGYSVAKISGTGGGIEVSTAAPVKKVQKSEKQPAFISKIKFNFSLFIFLLLIYYLLKTQIYDQKKNFQNKFLKNILMGTLFWIAFPFITILLLGSVIGIPVWLIFVMFLIFGLLMGLVTISLWLGDHLYGKKNLMGFILGYVTVVLVDYILYSMDYFLQSINIIWIAYLYWLGMIFISTGITLRFLKSIFSKNKQ